MPILNGGVIAGSGYGLYNGSNILGDIFGFSAAELRANPPLDLPNNTQLGNWGEIATAQEFKRLGYNIPSTVQANTLVGGGHQGLDIAAYDSKANIDYIGESKASKAINAGEIPPRMNPANPSSGLPRQMSNQWITNVDPNTNMNRIQAAMPEGDATRVLGKINNGGDGVVNVASVVSWFQ